MIHLWQFLANSMAPPIPKILFPGITQLAISPYYETCSAPSIVIYICPPRIISKLVSLLNIEAPVTSVIDYLLGFIISGSTYYSVDGNGPIPNTPFSPYNNTPVHYWT